MKNSEAAMIPDISAMPVNPKNRPSDFRDTGVREKLGDATFAIRRLSQAINARRRTSAIRRMRTATMTFATL